MIFLLAFAPVRMYAIDLTDCGVLNAAGSYVLQNDVTSAGTCFTVKADNVTLDLNGHTVTYGDEPPIPVPNGSFENGTTGWDLSGAPHASVRAGLYEKKQVFEGSYALVFASVTAGGSESVTTQNAITLKANQLYNISAMCSGDIGAYTDILDAGTGVVLKTYKFNTSSDHYGFKYYPDYTRENTAVDFSVPVQTDIKIRLRVQNNLQTTETEILDDVRITPSRSYGVAALACYRVFPGEPCGGSANNMVVKNGTINQGQGKAYRGYAFYLRSVDVNNFEIANINSTIGGPSTNHIWSQGNDNPKIHDNVFTSVSKVVGDRHQVEGGSISLYNGVGGSVYRNTLIDSPQGGIIASEMTGMEIYSNDISHAGRFTNDFGIYSWGDDQYIHDNYIHPTSGRGIYIRDDRARIVNNRVEVTEKAWNNEYGGCQTGGAYGIQLEKPGNDNIIQNNHVTVTADECSGFALRITSDDGSTGNVITNNTFIALGGGTGAEQTSSFSMNGTNSTKIKIENNVFQADNSNFHFDWGGGIVNFTNNRIIKGPSPSSYKTIFFENASPASIRFLNNSFENGAADNSAHQLRMLTWVSLMEVVKLTPITATVLTGEGQPLPNATVTVYDKSKNTTSVGTTDSQGKAIVGLASQRLFNTATLATNIESMGDSEVSASAAGYEKQSVVAAASATDVTITMAMTEAGAALRDELAKKKDYLFTPNRSEPVIDWVMDNAGTLEVKIVDRYGKEVFSKNQDVPAGFVSLSIREANLSSGTYALLIEADGKKVRRKITWVR